MVRVVRMSLRPEEAHAFSVPAAIGATLPRRAQELLGFAEHNPAPRDGGRLWLVDFEDPAHLFNHPDIPITAGVRFGERTPS